MQKKISKEIVNMLEGYETISGKAGYAVFIHDTRGNIFEVNKRAEKLTGYPRKELLNMNVMQLHTKKELNTSIRKLRLIEETKREVEFGSQMQKKNGKAINVKITGDKFKFKNITFVIGMVREIAPHAKLWKAKKRRSTTKPNSDKFSKQVKNMNKEGIGSLHLLIEIAEARDPYTMKHSVKVKKYVELLARRVEFSEKNIESLKLASMLHDIGKIGIDQDVLTKPGALTKAEYSKVKKHPLLSTKMIRRIPVVDKQISKIVKYHHENYGGGGYPTGLRGTKIPLGARILAIADTYDALRSNRAYRKAYSYPEAVGIMKSERGKRFDPKLVDIFLDCLQSEAKK
ncbi:MAG: HD domain-containing protein [Candidatus Omnitrophica bacterium]|nr:HD domain-containing protein [Candidatus Omnitrophota bacterium]